MKTPEFTSVFAENLEQYLAFKEAMGFTGVSRIWYLKQFDAYCIRNDASNFDRATIEGWVKERLSSSGTYRSWMSYIRDFGRWLALHHVPDAYILDSSWKAPFVRPQPYLLAQEEIERFFVAAAQVHTRSPWAWQAVAFFVLMHCCGLRTGETRNLSVNDVDLQVEQITITNSKGHRSRCLPLGTEVAALLRSCDALSRQQFPSRKSFFVSAMGTQVAPAAVAVMFARIWGQAGLPRPDGGVRPRPYDFRHHFAYANLERWMVDGTDVAAMLPYLQVYMGHANIDSTYYYIHTSPDFMNDYAAITHQTSKSLLPEAGFQ